MSKAIIYIHKYDIRKYMLGEWVHAYSEKVDPPTSYFPFEVNLEEDVEFGNDGMVRKTVVNFWLLSSHEWEYQRGGWVPFSLYKIPPLIASLYQVNSTFVDIDKERMKIRYVRQG